MVSDRVVKTMSRIAVKFFKKQFQPIEPEPNSVYFVQENTGDPVELYVTNADGEYTDAGNSAFVEGVMAAALALKADLASPEFTGTPTAPTPPEDSSSNRLATTQFVHDAVNSLENRMIAPLGRFTAADTTRDEFGTDKLQPDPYLTFTDVPAGSYEIRGLLKWDSSDAIRARINGWSSGTIQLFGPQSGRVTVVHPEIFDPGGILDPNSDLDRSPGIWWINGVVILESSSTVSLNWGFLDVGPTTLKQGSFLTLLPLVGDEV